MEIAKTEDKVSTAEEQKTEEFWAVDLQQLQEDAEKPAKKKAGRHPDSCDCEGCIKRRGYSNAVGEHNIPKPDHIGSLLRAVNIVLRKISEPLSESEIKEGQELLFPIYKDLFPKFGGEKSKYYAPGVWAIDVFLASRSYDLSGIYKRQKPESEEKTDVKDETTGKQTFKKKDWSQSQG